MSEEIRELTGEESLEEIERYYSAKGIDVTAEEEPSEEELSESDLEAVAGGMGYIKAAAITAKAYYEIKKYGKVKSYSSKTVLEALDKTDQIVTIVGEKAIATLVKFFTTGTI